MAGQTINDRLLAARHSLAGQGLAKSVCKATTEEIIGPKKKHLDYLVHCTNEPNVSIPQLANLLIERTQNTNWVVVYKSLITVHHLLCYGNERFTQYLASSNSTFQLSSFLDRSGVQAGVGQRVGYDMSPFIRRYAKYLNEKALSYRTVAFDFCKVKRGKEDGTLRTMNAEKLLKTLPSLQAQVDALLEFDCSANDLSNGVINMCFMLLFRDLIRLFACYNDGIINLLEKYFDMNKKQCRDALDLYKKFLIRMDRVGEFLKVAENVGIDKGDIPDLTKAPSSLLDALEQHLAVLEGKKGSAANTPTQTQSNRTNVKSGVSALSCTSSSFGTAATSNGIDESLRQQALAEEEAALRQYNAKVQSPINSGTNPFLASGPPSQPIVDLFGGGGGGGMDSGMGVVAPTKASDDLLQLGNPFADMFGGGPAVPAVANTAPPVIPPAPANWATNGFGSTQTSVSQAFVSDNAFSSVFGSNDPNAASGIPNPFMSETTSGVSSGGFFDTGNDFFASAAATAGANIPPPRPPPPVSGPNTPSNASPAKSALDDLNDSIRMALGGSPTPQPPSLANAAQITTQPAVVTAANQGFAAFGPTPSAAAPFSPARQGVVNPSAAPSKVLTGDLDSSLASLAENLTMNKGGAQAAKGVQWNSPKSAAKPGAAGWTPQPIAATTGANYRPMGPGLTLLPASPARYPYQPSSPTIFGMTTAGGVRPQGVPLAGQPQSGSQAQMDPFGALM